ncbi:MAG: hypothetical protein R2731_14570 [Nocardioides sp.]
MTLDRPRSRPVTLHVATATGTADETDFTPSTNWSPSPPASVRSASR